MVKEDRYQYWMEWHKLNRIRTSCNVKLGISNMSSNSFLSDLLKALRNGFTEGIVRQPLKKEAQFNVVVTLIDNNGPGGS
jgi:hypothetical protein